MSNSNFRKHVAFAKEWQDDCLYFIFHGAPRKFIEDIFSNLRAVCVSVVTTDPVRGMKNGMCHRKIVVKILNSQAVREDELTEMIVLFLRKKHFDAEYFDDFQKFVNA